MLPVIALVGRPNVGKSTLFNYLTRTRDAIVADFPGLTRDRLYGRARRTRKPCLVVDTGGITEQPQGIDDLALRQVGHALEESDVVLFLVDARDGLLASDQLIAERLRRIAKPVFLVVNKIDGLNSATATLDFHAMGLGEPWPVAASHGTGLPGLLEAVERALPETEGNDGPEYEGIRIAVVGRPNVGKSTLVNRLLGEERVVVFDQPGTTRDSIFIPFERSEQKYVLIDTAGIRRRARVHETIEKFSVVKALQAIEKAHVVIYLIDAQEGVTDQDAHLLGTVCEAGRALIVGLNKWDGLTPEQRQQVRRLLDVKLTFLDFAQKHVLSALHGSGVGNLFDEIPKLYDAAMRDLATPLLTRILSRAMESHQPPLVRGRRVKLKYAHQGGHNPPVIVIHGNQTEEVPLAYQRYLANTFREALKLQGTPLRLEFRSSENPFEGRRNTLTPRQIHKRRRMMRHVKNSK